MHTVSTAPTGRHVVIAGGGFAGIAAAYTLRERLSLTDRVTLISPNPYFVFAPSLVRAALGESLLHNSFSLEAALAAQGIEYVHSHVRKVEVKEHCIRTDAGEMSYDRLIVATGGRPDTSQIPGLAGEFRQASWIVGEDSALEARNALRSLAEAPGPLVIGVAQGATYMSAAYELALALDASLRKQDIRDRVPLTFVTAEPYLGHFGFGQTAASDALRDMFNERAIETRVGCSIRSIEQHAVTLENGETLETKLSIIMPPFTGAVDIWKSAGLTDSSGMIPVHASFQHTWQSDVYAAGVAAYFAAPIPPLGNDPAPHTGYLAVHMGKIAAQHVAASLHCGTPATNVLPYMLDVRVLDGGADGLLLTSRGRKQLRHSATHLPGPTARYLKTAIERALIWRLRTGRVGLL